MNFVRQETTMFAALYLSCLFDSYNLQLCPDIVFAATPPYDGTLARYYKVPADLAYVLPDHLTLEDGAMVCDSTNSTSHSHYIADGTACCRSTFSIKIRWIPQSAIHCCLWMWSRWITLHGCRKGSWCIPCNWC